jgi:hypothetical protein
MRQELEQLDDKLNRMDVGYSTNAICDLREVLRKILELLDQTMPIDRSDDV